MIIILYQQVDLMAKYKREWSVSHHLGIQKFYVKEKMSLKSYTKP